MLNLSNFLSPGQSKFKTIQQHTIQSSNRAVKHMFLRVLWSATGETKNINQHLIEEYFWLISIPMAIIITLFCYGISRVDLELSKSLSNGNFIAFDLFHIGAFWEADTGPLQYMRWTSLCIVSVHTSPSPNFYRHYNCGTKFLNLKKQF